MKIKLSYCSPSHPKIQILNRTLSSNVTNQRNQGWKYREETHQGSKRSCTFSIKLPRRQRSTLLAGKIGHLVDGRIIHQEERKNEKNMKWNLKDSLKNHKTQISPSTAVVSHRPPPENTENKEEWVLERSE